MNDRDFEVLKTYVRTIADRLALRDWTFLVKREPAPRGVNADIECIEGRKYAVIRLAWDFREDYLEDQRHTIVHELLHCHLASATHAIELDADKMCSLNDHEHSMLFQPFMRQLEYGIDGIADGISPLFPLIEWPSDETKDDNTEGPTS